MRPWLLLLSLLVSDLSPLGDGDGVVENYSWSLYGKLLLDGQMSPRGPGTFTRRSCVYVAVQPKQRTSPSFLWAFTVHGDRGCRLPHQEVSGTIHRKHTPALVIKLHGEGKGIPAFLLKSDTLPALRVVSEIRPKEAGGKTGHIGSNIMKDLPDAGSAWPLHHHTAASGHNIQAFSLEKSKSWAPATIVQRRKMLTERCCAAATVIVSCCFRRGETRSALKIKKIPKQQTAQAEIKQKESTRRAMAMQAGRRSSKAARLRSVKTSHASQLHTRRRAVRIIKKNELFNLDKQQRSVQRQRSLKAAHDDGDGFFVKRQRSLVPREKAASINRLKCKMRAARDDDKEDFSGKIIAKQAEFRRPGGGSETGRSRANAVENGERGRLAHVRRADLTRRADDNGVDREQALRGEVLIALFLPDSETQTDPSLRKNIVPNTDTGWETVNTPIQEPDGPPHTTKVLKENFIFQPDNSKCRCLKEISFLLEIYAQDRTEGMNLKPAESAAEVTTAPARTAGEVTETSSSTPPGNTSINQETKQEEGEPSEEPVVPSPPSLKTTETETVTAGQTAETTTPNLEMKETPSSTDVSNQGSTQTADSRSTEETPTTKTSPESETEPGYDINNNNNNTTQATTQASFFGLRMREDIPKETTKRLHKGAESEETNGPGNERNEDPKVNSFTFPSQTSHKQDTDTLLETADDNAPLCGGLVHRTDAGWKHCVERFAGAGSKTSSSEGHTDSDLDDDGYDHFYYLDGKLRRVQKNFYPYRRGQRRRRSTGDGEFRARRRDTRENLLGFIRQLALRNKASRFR